MEYNKIEELRNLNHQQVNSYFWEFSINNRVHNRNVNMNHVFKVFTAYLAIRFKEKISSKNEENKLLDFVEHEIKALSPNGLTLIMEIEKHFSDLYKDLVVRFEKDLLLSYVLFSNDGGRYSSDSSTPISIINLAQKLLEITDNDTVLDLCSGTGSFLNMVNNTVNPKHSNGVELDVNNYDISIIRTIIQNNDISFSLNNVLNINFNEYLSDKVFSNFPLGMRMTNLDYQSYENKFLFNFFKDSKLTTSTDWMFVKAAQLSIKKGGKGVCILKNSTIWNASDTNLRRYFLENGYIESVILLPSNLLESATIPVTLIVISENNKSIRMIDARDIFTKGRRNNTLSNNDIEKTYELYKNDSDLSKIINLSQINKEDYSLNPVVYLDYPEQMIKGSQLEEYIIDVTRGIPIRSSELDKLVVPTYTGKKYLMLQNINDGIISDDLPNLSDIDERYSKYIIKPGSLILSKNSPFKVVLFENAEDDVLANVNMYILEIDKNKINPAFVAAYLQSNHGMSQLERYSKGTSLHTISVQDLKRIIIPDLSKDEQDKLAEKYQQLNKELKNVLLQTQLISSDKQDLFSEVI